MFCQNVEESCVFQKMYGAGKWKVKLQTKKNKKQNKTKQNKTKQKQSPPPTIQQTNLNKLVSGFTPYTIFPCTYFSFQINFLIFDFWCLTPLSAISWRPVLVVEEAGVLQSMGKQLVNFITCGCESSAPFFVIYKAGREPTSYW